MRYFQLIWVLFPMALHSQNFQKEINAVGTSTFGKIHLNEWLFIQHYQSHTDTIIFTEAASGDDIFQSWENISAVIVSQDKLLVVDKMEQTVFMLPKPEVRKAMKGKLIVLDDSLSFLFGETRNYDTIEKVEHGYTIKSNGNVIGIYIDSEGMLINRFTCRWANTESEEEVDLLQTEWVLRKHLDTEADIAPMLSLNRYVSEHKNVYSPVGEYAKYELVNMLNE